MSNMQDLMGNIISLAKRRGFIFAGSDIYGGLAQYKGVKSYRVTTCYLSKNR